MIKYVLIFLFVYCQCLSGEDKTAWNAWQKLEKFILANDEKQSITLLSGRMKEGFFKFGMTSINNEVRDMEAKFIKEFANEAENTRFLIVDVKGEQRTLMFIKEGKEWLFDEQTSESYGNAEDASIALGQFIAHQKLEKIYNAVARYCQENKVKRIPPPAEMKLPEDLLTFRDPANGKSKNIKVARNVNFEGSSKLLLAVTEDILGAAHHAIFEDAHIGTVSREKYKEHEEVLGIIESRSIRLEEKEIDRLAGILGKGKSKERKAAREQLLKLDENSLKFLVKYKDSPDLETRLSMNEIIETISKKSSQSRPEF